MTSLKALLISEQKREKELPLNFDFSSFQKNKWPCFKTQALDVK